MTKQSAYVVVRATHDGYQTSTVNKQRASCTTGPKQAAERLAVKLYGPGDHIVKELTTKVAVHGVTQWHITAGAPST